MTYASEAGHWYDRDGNQFDGLIGKNGKWRRAHVGDARKLGLVPGATSVIKCAHSEGLKKYFREQMAAAAYYNPPIAGEDLAAYTRRLWPISEEHSTTARDIGKVIHGCLEKHLLGQTYDQTHKLCVDGALACLDGWCGLADLRPEKSFAHPLGYGGKCDIHKQVYQPIPGGFVADFKGFVADFKSKDFGEDEFPQAYDNHAMQISAYGHGFGMPSARGAIIFVSTKVPGLARLVEIPKDDIDKGWKMFCALLDYWKAKNSID